MTKVREVWGRGEGGRGEGGEWLEKKRWRDFRDSREQKQNIKDSQVSLLCTFLFLLYHTIFFNFFFVWLPFVARRCKSKSILIQIDL